MCICIQMCVNSLFEHLGRDLQSDQCLCFIRQCLQTYFCVCAINRYSNYQSVQIHANLKIYHLKINLPNQKLDCRSIFGYLFFSTSESEVQTDVHHICSDCCQKGAIGSTAIDERRFCAHNKHIWNVRNTNGIEKKMSMQASPK